MQDEIIHEAERYDRMSDPTVKEGRVSGAIYTDFPPDLMKVQQKVYSYLFNMYYYYY
jgi:hypothetical protein